jgi:hypothetical protein
MEGMRYLFEVHTKTKMYQIMATYFIADSDGVMFFDDQQRGIGFVPNVNLQFARPAPPKPVDIDKLMNWHAVMTNKTKDD